MQQRVLRTIGTIMLMAFIATSCGPDDQTVSPTSAPNGGTPTPSPTIEALRCPPDMVFTAISGSGDQVRVDLYLLTDCGRTKTRVDANNPEGARLSPDANQVSYVDQVRQGGDIGEVIFVSDRIGNRRQITEFGGDYSSPSWSPDGKLIAYGFESYSGETGGLYTVNPDGTSETRVSYFGAPYPPVWSADSTKLWWVDPWRRNALTQVSSSGASNPVILALLPSKTWVAARGPDGKSLILAQQGSTFNGTKLSSYDLATGRISHITEIRNMGYEGEIAIANDWTLYYGVSDGEDETGSRPADMFDIIGLHGLRVDSGLNTRIVDNEEIMSLDVQHIGPVAPTPIPFLPNFETVFLGDSYASGEGAPTKLATGKTGYLPGTDTKTNKCHRSMGAWPVLVHQDKFKGMGLEFHACSGAKIEDFWSPNPSNKGERAQLDWLNARTKYVFVQVGGNNAHFGDVMQECVFNGLTDKPCQDTWKGAIDSAIYGLGVDSPTHDSLPKLYREIRLRSPKAKIYAIGYPRFFSENDYSFCSTGVPARYFNPVDIVWMNNEVTNLNKAIEVSAKKIGVDYVNIYGSFNGHNLCSQKPWLNSATLPKSGSFHPNTSGHTAIAADLEASIS